MFCLLFSHQVTSDSFTTSWTVACKAPLSMGLSRQEYWSGSPFFSLRDLSNPGIEPMSPDQTQVSCIAGRFFMPEPPGKSLYIYIYMHLINIINMILYLLNFLKHTFSHTLFMTNNYVDIFYEIYLFSLCIYGILVY